MLKSRLSTNIEKANQAKEVIKASPLFQRAVFEFQSKWHLLKDDEDREANLNKLPEAKHFVFAGKKPLFSHRYIKKGSPQYKDVIKILKQFSLSEHYWLESISHYLLYNKFPRFQSTDTAEADPMIIEKKDPTSRLPIIYIRLGRNTTLDDIKDLWPLIRPSLTNEEDDSIRRRFNPINNASRDSDVFKLYQRRYYAEDIAREIRVKYKEDLEFGHIAKIISEKKKELGIKDKTKLLTSRIKRERLP